MAEEKSDLGRHKISSPSSPFPNHNSAIEERSELSSHQQLFLQYLAFQLVAGNFDNNDKGLFKRICDGTQTQNREKPFGDPGSASRRSAQQILHSYKKTYRRRSSNRTLFSPVPPEYSPFTNFLDRQTSQELLNSIEATSYASAEQIKEKQGSRFSSASFTTPPPTVRSHTTTTANMSESFDDDGVHDVWYKLAGNSLIDSVALFHDDASFAKGNNVVGYGPEKNWPGIHCMINHGVAGDNGAVHNQMVVMFKCTVEDANLITAKLTEDGNGIELMVPVLSSLVATELELVLKNIASGFADGHNQERNTNFSVMLQRFQKELHTEQLGDADVPMKKITLLFPPPFTCNNTAFNGRPVDARTLTVYPSATSSMQSERKLMMKIIKILNEKGDDGPEGLAGYEDEDFPDPVGSGDDTNMADLGRGAKRGRGEFDKKASFLKAASVLKKMILETTLCVYCSVQLVIDTEEVKKQFQKKSERKMNAFFEKMDIKG